mmetsp:Transcript_12519/g.16854  ORF Transcript_12519/g.16854 Transcript_12519/m.16854 type:complete len:98 (-) Transcript_12519:529-822(-)
MINKKTKRIYMQQQNIERQQTTEREKDQRTIPSSSLSRCVSSSCTAFAKELCRLDSFLISCSPSVRVTPVLLYCCRRLALESEIALRRRLEYSAVRD